MHEILMHSCLTLQLAAPKCGDKVYLCVHVHGVCVCVCVCVVLCTAGQFQVVEPVQDDSSEGGGSGFKKRYKLSNKDFLLLEHPILDCPGMH